MQGELGKIFEGRGQLMLGMGGKSVGMTFLLNKLPEVRDCVRKRRLKYDATVKRARAMAAGARGAP